VLINSGGAGTTAGQQASRRAGRQAAMSVSQEQVDTTSMVVANAFGAMMKIFLVSTVGVLCAKYPKGNPLLPVPVLKNVSRFCNAVLVPCLIIGNLGASLSLRLLSRVGILIPISISVNLLSLLLAMVLKPLHEDDSLLYRASSLTVSSPNTISMPLMVMQSLCEQEAVNADFDGSSVSCFAESTALMFIYSIGFHLMFWGYVFPTFEHLQLEYNARNDGLPLMEEHHEFNNSDSSSQNEQDDSNANSSRMSYNQVYARLVTLAQHVLLSPSMLGIFAGLFIGLVPSLQWVFFSTNGFLYPIGGAIKTLASPVVAMNCIIMAASLAHIEVDFKTVFGCKSSKKTDSVDTQDISVHNPVNMSDDVSSKHSIADIELTHRRRNLSSSEYNPVLMPGYSNTETVEEGRSRQGSQADIDKSKHADSVISGAMVDGAESTLIGQIPLEKIKQDDVVPRARTIVFLIVTRLHKISHDI
jgi:hypothetical protein